LDKVADKFGGSVAMCAVRGFVGIERANKHLFRASSYTIDVDESRKNSPGNAADSKSSLFVPLPYEQPLFTDSASSDAGP
jgi:hypothetical protein